MGRGGGGREGGREGERNMSGNCIYNAIICTFVMRTTGTKKNT